MNLDLRVASRLTVIALSHGLELKATRIAKAPLHHAGEIIRLALLTLEDTHAPPLGIDALTVELRRSLPACQARGAVAAQGKARAGCGSSGGTLSPEPSSKCPRTTLTP